MRRDDTLLRRGPIGSSGFLEGMVLALVVTTMPLFAAAQEDPFPLEPPDTTSPRGTLFNLIDNVVEAHRILEAATREYEATPGLFKSKEVLEQESRAEVHLKRAAGH